MDSEGTPYLPSETVVFVDELESVVGVVLNGRYSQVNSCRLLDDCIPTSPVLVARLNLIERLVLRGGKLEAKGADGARGGLGIGGQMFLLPLGRGVLRTLWH